MRLILTFALSVAVSGWTCADDYVRDRSPSKTARAYFAALRDDQEAQKVVKNGAQKTGEGDAYYTDDGAISIPPGAMVAFKMRGKCMDPHLPAPASGEPMQFVDTSRLIPEKLRGMYDNLIARQSQGDREVLSNNPQHLVWAIRTAGTEDPMANNLSDSQLAVLDECAGRRGTFMKYHEKEKRRNARRSRRRGGTPGGNRISVGGFSYDAADLRGTNGVRRIESHISMLTEMGEKSKERAASDFRYGEIEEELYSDIVCNGGLSFTAKILNASDHVKYFRAGEFAAQVGNGQIAGSRRQRVTMCPPDEFIVVMDAAQEGVEIDRDLSIAEIEGEAHQRIRGRRYRKRQAKTVEWHSRTTHERERTQKTKTETTTVIEEPVPSVSPVEPASPIVIRETVTNNVVRNVPVAEEVVVRVISLEYDARTRKGALTVEILRGAFKKANKYIRKNFDDLVRKKSPAEDTAKIPTSARLEIESISISDDDRVEVRFVAKMGR